jgi:DnaK suppressor protein
MGKTGSPGVRAGSHLAHYGREDFAGTRQETMAGRTSHIETEQRDTLRTMLLKLRGETYERVRQFRRDQEEDAEPAPADEMDEARSSADVETHAGLIGRAEERLKYLDDALARLDEGKYGVCIRCGEAIPFERLMAVPFALQCVDCQGKRNDGERRAGEGGTIAPYDQLWTPPEEMIEPPDRDALRTSPDEDLSVGSVQPAGARKRGRPTARKTPGKKAR